MSAGPYEPKAARTHQRTANFDGLANAYRWMEWFSFGPWLWWCRTAFLPEMQSATRALTFGDGDGRFTARLLAVNGKVRVEAVDASDAMLAQLKRAAGPHAARVHVTLADARTWGIEQTVDPQQAVISEYDLVYTHFFLDCLTDEETQLLARRVAERLQPGGIWVVSEFAIPKTWLRGWAAQCIVGLLYRAFAVLTGLGVRRLPDYRTALRDAGLRVERQRRWLGGLLVSECWSRADSNVSAG